MTINAASHASVKTPEGKYLFWLGCDKPECKPFFLAESEAQGDATYEREQREKEKRKNLGSDNTINK